jgi:hypothetical protein
MLKSSGEGSAGKKSQQIEQEQRKRRGKNKVTFNALYDVCGKGWYLPCPSEKVNWWESYVEFT